MGAIAATCTCFGKVAKQYGTFEKGLPKTACCVGIGLIHEQVKRQRLLTIFLIFPLQKLSSALLGDCRVPTNPTGGKYPAAGATTEGSTKRISCSTGYAVNPSGTTPITCQAGGSWTAPSIPPCLRKFCQNNINMTLHHPPLAHDHTRV